MGLLRPLKYLLGSGNILNQDSGSSSSERYSARQAGPGPQPTRVHSSGHSQLVRVKALNQSTTTTVGIHRTSTRKYHSVGEHSEGLSENQHLYNATPLLPRVCGPQWTAAEQQCISSQQGLTEQLLLHASQ